MIGIFDNYGLLRIIETRDLLTKTCAKLESRLYTSESEEGKKYMEVGDGRGVSNEAAHVRTIPFI